ncbi:Alpha/Beta hydrolase protein [Aspergillus falconensis]
MRKVLQRIRSDSRIVFIHGITGSSMDTWCHKETQFYWPSSIGPDVCSARVFTFGYDADVMSIWHPVSQLGIDSHSQNLLGSLARVRSDTGTDNRQIFFITHSLGGLVAQNALCLSQVSAEKHIRLVGDCTAAIMFLGTPHLGSDLASWARYGTNLASMVTRPARNLLSLLEPRSEMLASIQERFHNIVRSRKDEHSELLITCFYEELPVAIVGLVSLDFGCESVAYVHIGRS